jgi:hypothetical protein
MLSPFIGYSSLGVDQSGFTVTGGRVSGRHPITVNCRDPRQPGLTDTEKEVTWGSRPLSTDVSAGSRLDRRYRGDHQIPVMRYHLPKREDGDMDPTPARYTIRINGHLGATVLSAFPAMTSETQGGSTVLTGLLDRAALAGLLSDVEALGLELVEVRRLERPTQKGSDHV